MDFTEQDFETLGEKLDSLHLEDGERAALVAMFDAATDDQVAGFALDLSFKQLAGKAFSASGTGNIRPSGLYEELSMKPGVDGLRSDSVDTPTGL